MPDVATQSTDWILGELESIARNADPQNVFYSKLTQALVPILECDCVMLALELDSKPAVLYSAGIKLDANLISLGLGQAFPQAPSSGPESSSEANEAMASHWISTRFPTNKPSRPLGLLAYFSTPVDLRRRSGAKNLIAAFAEVCELRELYVENSRMVGLMTRTLAKCQDLSGAQSHAQLHRGLVETLRDALEADRVSMYMQRANRTSMVACSGVASIDANASAVKDLEQTAEELLAKNEPKLWNASEDSRTIPSYRLFLPWPTGSEASRCGMLVECSEPQAVIDRVQRVSSLFPVINQAWQNQNRWLHLPTQLQQLPQRDRATGSHLGHRAKLLLWLAALAGLLGLGMIPYPLYVQTEAVLEPLEQRFVHATADSFIQELLVREGQKVIAQEPLVQLRSPSLDLQIEESEGQLLALEEKKNSLRVAVNQLSSNASDVANQTRLSAELKIIEIQAKQALEKRLFFRQQQSELLLKSPIQGVVVGGDLKRELSDRPLQRGDVLFRVADVQGPWKLKILVADRDGAYVQKALEDGPIQIDWGLENSTHRRQSANLSSITSEVQPRPDGGPCRIASATLETGQLEQPVIGAIAYVRIPCGKQPLWFIWSRPLVEFLQKRFWLTTSSETKN